MKSGLVSSSPVNGGNQPLLDATADSRCLLWQRRRLELRGNQLVFLKERSRLLRFLRSLLRLGKKSATRNLVALSPRHIAISFPANKLAVFEDHNLHEAFKAASVEDPSKPRSSHIKASRLDQEIDQWLKARYDASDPLNRCWIVFATNSERNQWEAMINDHISSMRTDKLSRASTEDDVSTIEEEIQEDPLMQFYNESRNVERLNYAFELRRAETKHFRIGRRFHFRPRSSSCFVKKIPTKRDRLHDNFSFVRNFVQSKESISPSRLPSHFVFN